MDHIRPPGTTTPFILRRGNNNNSETVVGTTTAEMPTVSDKPPRRKQKGAGNWTRTILACQSCRKMKIRCDDERPCNNCKRMSYDCISTPAERSPAPRKAGAVTDNPIRRRMQRIERSLQSRQPGDELPDEISSALEGVECLLGLAQPQQEIRESVTRDSVLSDIQSVSHTTVSPGVSQYAAAPEVIGSPEGSQKSHGRPALFSEATHKRWAAQSAVGQSCTGISPIDPRFQRLETVGLPGADEPPKPQNIQRLILPGFPTSDHALQLFDAYCTHVNPFYNIIPTPTVKELLETVRRDGPQFLTLAEQAFLFMVFALGSLVRNDAAAETFYNHTQAVALDVYSETSMESCTLAFLTTLYQLTTGKVSAAWTTFGLVVRIAQALGYHRNVSRWGLSAYHEECRRRIWANIYSMDAFQSVIYGRPPLIQDSDCDVDSPSAILDDATLQPDQMLPSLDENAPKQIQFHIAYYRLSRIVHQMMKRLYLNVDSKFDAWETIRNMTERLQEYHVLLPKHLRDPHNPDTTMQNEIITSQAIFLNFYFNHINIICCRPLLVERQPNSSGTQDALGQRRWQYSRDIAQNAANHISQNMNDGLKCGHLARMLFSVSGLWLNAAEVLALQALTSPKESPEEKNAMRDLNKFLTFFTFTNRPAPQTARSTTILKELIRVVVRINNEGQTGEKENEMVSNSEGGGLTEVLDPMLGLGMSDVSSAELLSDFLNHDPFPTLAMDDMIWVPENTISSVWGNLGEWKDLM